MHPAALPLSSFPSTAGAPLNIVQCGVTQGGVQQCSIMRVRLDGTGLQTFAYGQR